MHTKQNSTLSFLSFLFFFFFDNSLSRFSSLFIYPAWGFLVIFFSKIKKKKKILSKKRTKIRRFQKSTLSHHCHTLSDEVDGVQASQPSGGWQYRTHPPSRVGVENEQEQNTSPQKKAKKTKRAQSKNKKNLHKDPFHHPSSSRVSDCRCNKIKTKKKSDTSLNLPTFFYLGR